MSLFVKKIQKPESELTILAIKRYCHIYRNRIGKYKYIVVFNTRPSVHGKKIGMFFSGEKENGVPYGFFNGVKPESIRGTEIEVDQVPQEYIKIIKWELQNSGHL